MAEFLHIHQNGRNELDHEGFATSSFPDTNNWNSQFGSLQNKCNFKEIIQINFVAFVFESFGIIDQILQFDVGPSSETKQPI